MFSLVKGGGGEKGGGGKGGRGEKKRPGPPALGLSIARRGKSGELQSTGTKKKKGKDGERFNSPRRGFTSYPSEKGEGKEKKTGALRGQDKAHPLPTVHKGKEKEKRGSPGKPTT